MNITIPVTKPAAPKEAEPAKGHQHTLDEVPLDTDTPNHSTEGITYNEAQIKTMLMALRAVAPSKDPRGCLRDGIQLSVDREYVHATDGHVLLRFPAPEMIVTAFPDGNVVAKLPPKIVKNFPVQGDVAAIAPSGEKSPEFSQVINGAYRSIQQNGCTLLCLSRGVIETLVKVMKVCQTDYINMALPTPTGGLSRYGEALVPNGISHAIPFALGKPRDYYDFPTGMRGILMPCKVTDNPDSDVVKPFYPEGVRPTEPDPDEPEEGEDDRIRGYRNIVTMCAERMEHMTVDHAERALNDALSQGFLTAFGVWLLGHGTQDHGGRLQRGTADYIYDFLRDEDHANDTPVPPEEETPEDEASPEIEFDAVARLSSWAFAEAQAKGVLDEYCQWCLMMLPPGSIDERAVVRAEHFDHSPRHLDYLFTLAKQCRDDLAAFQASEDFDSRKQDCVVQKYARAFLPGLRLQDQSDLGYLIHGYPEDTTADYIYEVCYDFIRQNKVWYEGTDLTPDMIETAAC